MAGRTEAGIFPYVRRLGARTWDLVGHVDILLALVTAGVAVLAWREVIKPPWDDRLLTACAIALLLLTVGFAVFVAPFIVWSDERRRVEDLTAAPDLGLSVVGPLAWRQSLQSGAPPVDGWLLRLMVHNASERGHYLHARVTKTDGVPPGPEAPWWIPWRHGAASEHLLLPDDREILLIGWSSGVHGWLDVWTPQGASRELFSAPNQTFQLSIRLWDRDTTMLAKAVTMAVDLTSGTAVVTLTEEE